ncbi:MAG TPA: helix-turn-helix transcriptional regulator [Rhizomicrobium sp.]|nr:helix-turn-helix transcriptional regulator [Rhizomicrobium sp.]
MALFFDTQWFDSRLSAMGLSHGDVARALGLTPEQLAEMWKDQRELSVKDVRLLAALLGTDVKEIAERAGIATPVPRAAADLGDVTAKLENLLGRVERLERGIEDIKKLLLRRD